MLIALFYYNSSFYYLFFFFLLRRILVFIKIVTWRKIYGQNQVGWFCQQLCIAVLHASNSLEFQSKCCVILIMVVNLLQINVVRLGGYVFICNNKFHLKISSTQYWHFLDVGGTNFWRFWMLSIQTRIIDGSNCF